MVDSNVSSSIWNMTWSRGRLLWEMGFIWLVTIPLGALGVGILGTLLGYTADTMGPPERAIAAATSEAVQIALVLTNLSINASHDEPSSLPWLDYRPSPSAFALGLFGAVSSLAIVALFTVTATTLLGNTETIPDAKMAMMEVLGTNEAVLAAGVASIVLAPVLEETAYRGVLLPSLTTTCSVPISVVISSAAFAASHLLVSDLQSCLALFILGVILGTTVVVARGNMLAPLTAHSVYNAILFAATLQPKL